MPSPMPRGHQNSPSFWISNVTSIEVPLMLSRSLRICHSFIGGEVCDTIAAQTFAVAACNFSARRGSKMDFLAPTSWGHHVAQEFLATGFANFRFPLFRGS